MKAKFKNFLLVIFGALALLLPACKPSSQGLRIGMDYQNSTATTVKVGYCYQVYSSVIYNFGSQGVSVYRVLSDQGGLFRSRDDGSLWAPDELLGLVGGKKKGTSFMRGSQTFDVLLGSGDKMPVLVNAPYKIQGTSVYVDWSQGHSEYFPISGCGSGSEVLNIKNDGLVLESATTPGVSFTIIMN
jgi:hypothetical protein